MQQPSPRPPRVAAWLVSQFASLKQSESIPGDLLEEFSEVALKSGPKFARRWYWRQSVRTTAHLIGAAFRDGGWLIASTVVLGVLLLQFGYSLIEPTLVILLRTQRPYSSAHVDAYMFFLNNGILVGRAVLPFVVGCIVALAAKERELVSTMTLGFVLVALNAVGLTMSWANGYWTNILDLLPLLVHIVGNVVAIVLGGKIVRDGRRHYSAQHK